MSGENSYGCEIVVLTIDPILNKWTILIHITNDFALNWVEDLLYRLILLEIITLILFQILYIVILALVIAQGKSR